MVRSQFVWIALCFAVGAGVRLTDESHPLVPQRHHQKKKSKDAGHASHSEEVDSQAAPDDKDEPDEDEPQDVKHGHGDQEEPAEDTPADDKAAADAEADADADKDDEKKKDEDKDKEKGDTKTDENKSTTTTRKPGNPLEDEPVHKNDKEAKSFEQTKKQMSKEIMEAFESAPKDGGSKLDGFSCPKQESSNYKSEERYSDRSASGYCDDARGMDGGLEGPIGARYKFRAVAKLMGMKKGTSVLDWGAGCGHELDLIDKEMGIVGVGMDLVAENAVWAKKNLKNIKDFCAVEGSTLPFDDETFDFVMANGALHHIKPEDQCKAVKDHIFRVLRPGGCFWAGFMGGESDPPSVHEHAWGSKECLGSYDKLGPIFTRNEMDLFGITEYNRGSAYSLFVCRG
eukprot:TRINITY_DN100518_c0_g1_i1.p1 TRINITY_DN100518_c0_g1~~TRINITY_DN100518_c0_g1_i1.p1  ORF type:complete len:399 (-),score=120.70 TRINITY_DN100518_c0_g1_i1:83-1279(-)